MSDPPRIIHCLGCGHFWTEGGSINDEYACTCTCTDETGPHYEDWTVVRMPALEERNP